MTLKRTLVGIIRSMEGTSDRAKDPKLKTRYYNLSKERAWEEVSSTLKKIPGYKVLHEVPSVGEIILGSNYRTIMNLFSVLDKKLAKYKTND